MLKKIIYKKNLQKILFTPGPSSLSEANIINLNPSFGRGDRYYSKTEKNVLNKIKKISGHKNIITTQGSGSTVLEIISNQTFMNNVKRNSKYFHNQLQKLKEKHPKIIKEIRGRGFLIGLQLYKDQTNFIKRLMDNKLLTIRAAENVVRILPPLNVKKSEINEALKIINSVCLEF